MFNPMRDARYYGYLNPVISRYAESSKTYMMECFARIVKAVNYFRKKLYLRLLTGF